MLNRTITYFIQFPNKLSSKNSVSAKISRKILSSQPYKLLSELTLIKTLIVDIKKLKLQIKMFFLKLHVQSD